MNQIQPSNSTSNAQDELSIKELLGYFSFLRPYLTKILLLFFIPVIILILIGWLAAITSPKEYDAKCVLITDQVASTGNGSLAGLAALGGVQIPGLPNGAGGGGMESGGLGADLYPLILSNKPFLVELSKKPIYFESEKTITTLEVFFRREIKKNIVEKTIDFIRHPFSSTITNATVTKELINSIKDSTINNAEQFFSNNAFIADLTAENKKMITILSSRIKFTQTGKLITLSVKMPDPQLSAEATKMVLNLLIKYISKFKVSKQLENIRFLEARSAETEAKYKEAQQRLANFKDANYNVIFESIQSKEQQLQNEFTLAFTLYNQIATQLEQAKIQLKKDTPFFTVVEPVYIPEVVSKDPVKEIISYASVGVLIGILLNIFYIVIIVRGKQKINRINILRNNENG